MANERAHHDCLHWTGGWDSEPVWPREPDINVVRSLAKQQLVAELPPTMDDALLEVSFFAEGGFNKLYQISYAGHHTSYLLRVALPIEPYYKTESEVATIAYLRANTSIPVPRVFAWDSNPDNELTFEWILMEKIDGVPLYDVWRKVPWERKLELTETIAEMIKQLRDRKFDRIGGLYFTSAADPQGAELTGTTPVKPLAGSKEMKPMSSVNQTEFSIDRIFDPLFFLGSRLYLPGKRGPYQTSLEWLSAEVQVQLDWIKNGPIEDDEDYTSDFDEEAPKMESLCYEYLDNLPNVLGDEEKRASFTLYHSDLNAANILVHPETFEITGIVDWEMINVVPEWRASEHPKFLQCMEPMDEEEPPIPSYEDESDIAVYKRDRWDNRILRCHFDEAMKRLTRDDSFIDDKMKTKTKRDCHEFLPELTGMWNWSENWLMTYKTTGVSKNRVDWALETMEYSPSDTEA